MTTTVPPMVPAAPKVMGTWTLASSLLHGGEESLGTTRLFRTEGVIVDGRRVPIPVVSGNAIRGMWRRACALAFLDEYLAAGGAPLSLSAFYYLTSGGALKKGSSTGTLRLGEERALRDLIPHVGMFGGAGMGRIQQGKLLVGPAVPICRETLPYLRRQWPAVEDAPTAGLSIRELTEIQGYSRQDDGKQEVWHRYLSPEAQREAQGLLLRAETDDTAREAGAAQQMRYEAQVLITGTVLFHWWGFRWPPAREELAGFAAGLLRWAEHPHVGGRSAAGHGTLLLAYQNVQPETRLLTDGSSTLDVLRETSPQAILRAHVEAYRDAITDVLARL
jgi:CRISPR type IV-associated protein Csf2